MIWEPTIKPEAYAIEPQLHLPDGIKLFDVHTNPSGSTLVFLVVKGVREVLAVAPGENMAERISELAKHVLSQRNNR